MKRQLFGIKKLEVVKIFYIIYDPFVFVQT